MKLAGTIGKLEKADEFKKKLKLLKQDVRDGVLEAMGRAAMIIETEAKVIITRRKHVRTGNLRNSIQSRAGWANQTEIVGIVGTDVPYAPYVEALPDGGYLRPALMKKGAAAMKYLMSEIKKITDGVGGK